MEAAPIYNSDKSGLALNMINRQIEFGRVTEIRIISSGSLVRVSCNNINNNCNNNFNTYNDNNNLVTLGGLSKIGCASSFS